MACVGELPDIVLRLVAVETAGLFATAELAATDFVGHCESRAVVAGSGRAQHVRVQWEGPAREMGNLPAVEIWLDLEWVSREMAGLPGTKGGSRSPGR